MDTQMLLLTATIATVGLMSFAQKWEFSQLQQRHELEKRDAVIRALKEQPRQQINVNNQNNGLVGKQGK